MAVRCPCGRGEAYDECCGPVLAGARKAATAEALMRSRYTAFAVGDGAYLLRSWHPRTRPGSIELDPERRWRFLEILRTERGGPFDTAGVVEFAAHHRDPDGSHVLREVSRFERVDGAWHYLDGFVG